MYAWTPRNVDAFERESQYLHQAGIMSFRILRTRTAETLWPQIAADTHEWLGADAVRAYRLDADGIAGLAASAGTDAIPLPCVQMEFALSNASLDRERSLISNHPRLDPAFAALGEQVAHLGSVVHTLLVRVHQRTYGIVAVHWITSPRPGYERRAGFVHYWDNVGLAVATVEERAALERTVFVDALTALPNQRALEVALARHADTHPLGVLVLDFDGMRAANAAFENDYARGGDVLIVAVANALREFAGEGELAARMHTRGDEFCLLLPGRDDEGTARRRQQLQQLLTDLEVPESHRHVYRGASVGGAARAPGEPVAETLARASRAMHERKLATRSR